MPNLNEFNKEESKQSNSEWFNIPLGESRIRILSASYAVFPSHWIQSLKKSITCIGKENGCIYDIEVSVPKKDSNNQPLFIKREVPKRDVDGNIEYNDDGTVKLIEDENVPMMEKKIVHKPSLKYLMWLIDRKDGKMKIGKLTYKVVKAIADWKTTEEFGYTDIPGYDIIIQKTSNGSKSTDVVYTISAARQDTPLTNEEIKMSDNLPSLEEIVNKSKEKVKNQSSIPVSTNEIVSGEEDLI